LYSQDYESATDPSSWTSAYNAGGLSLQTDGGSGYSKYIQFYGDNLSGGRTAYTTFYTSDFYSDYTSYTVEFDAAVRQSQTASHYTELVVASDGYSLAGNDYFTNKNTTKKNYLFLLRSGGTANGTDYYINGGATSHTIANNTWFHVRLDVNVSTKTIAYTLTGAVSTTGSYTITDESSIKAKALIATVGKGYYGTVRIDNIVITAGHLENITYNLNVGSSASTTISSSTSTSDVTNISSISVDQTNAAGDGAGAGDNRTTKLPIKTGANGETYDTPTSYVLFKYSVAEGKQFIPTGITIRVANVGGSSANNIKYKATLSDASNSISGTYVGTCEDGTVEFFKMTNGTETAFTGDVTLKLWAWTIEDGSGKGSAFRMGTPLEIKGVVETLPEIVNAIADCKAFDTSAAFATAIDAESFTSAAKVYAFNTTYHITNGALTDGKRDITGVIRNAAVADATDWDGASILNGEKYTGAPDEYYLDKNTGSIDASQTIYNLPAGVYVLKAATRAKVGTSGTIYAWDGTNNHTTAINANGNTGGSLDNGWDWTELEFTLTSSANVKVGFWANVDGYWASCDDWHLYKVESVSKTISAAGWATYCSPYALDFSSSIANLTKAYLITGHIGATLTLSPISTTIPANTGILLEGEGEVLIPVTGSSSTDVSANILKGVTTATLKDAESIYVLMNEAAGVGFYKNNNDFNVGANTAYIDAADLAGARSFYLFEDDATAIEAVKAQNVENGQFFNLAGQRVAQPTKGLYIVNGKKVIIK
jgi:hypothetical protein